MIKIIFKCLQIALLAIAIMHLTEALTASLDATPENQFGQIDIRNIIYGALDIGLVVICIAIEGLINLIKPFVNVKV